MWACALAILVGTMVLFVFDPARHGFYPQCYFRKLTGWACPGCGGLRAAHELLHCRVGESFRLNPIVPLVGPFFLVWVGWMIWGWVRHRQLPEVRPAWWWILLVVLVVFGVGRNLV